MAAVEKNIADDAQLQKGRSTLTPQLRAIIDAWQHKRREDVHERVAARSAREQRNRYRHMRAAEGESVRRYHFHDHEPQRPAESRTDYEKRTHRDRQREYRGTPADSVRARTDLSQMMADEKADHERELTRKRQQRRRERQSQDSLRSRSHILSDEDLEALEEALATLEKQAPPGH